MKVVLFQSLTTKNHMEVEMDDVVRWIGHSDKIRKLVEAFRIDHDENVKKKLPAILPQCFIGERRTKECVKGLTGLSFCDFDHLSPDEVESLREVAINDPHTFLCYVTASGEGLRILFGFEFDANQPIISQIRYYREVFLGCNSYYEKLLGYKYDEACKDVVHLSALSYDEKVYYNPLAEPFGALKVSEETDFLKMRRADMSIVNGLDHMFEKVIEPSFEKRGLSFEPGHHNEFLVQVARKLSWYGVPLEETLMWADSRNFAKDYAECNALLTRIYDTVKGSFGEGARFVSSYRKRAKKKKEEAEEPKLKRAKVRDIKEFLNERIETRFNEIKGRVEYRKVIRDDEKYHELSDYALNSFWCEMDDYFNVNIDNISLVLDSDFSPLFNPLGTYLKSLPEWNPDMPDYIEELGETIHVEGGEKEQQLFQMCLKKWIVAMVGSWIDEDTVNQFILVLLGNQGIYKSTWFNYLLPPEIREYYMTKSNSSVINNDDMLALSNCGLMNFDEVDLLDNRYVNFLKSMVTILNTHIRAAYHRYAELRNHIASLCGTGNDRQFLTEKSEGRRWAIFWVEKIDSPRDKEFNYVGFFSQALYLFRHGFRHYFDSDEVRIMMAHNKQFIVPSPEEELIRVYIRKPYQGECGMVFSATEIAMRISSGSMSGKLSPVTIGRKMQEMGFREKRSGKHRGWVCMMRSVQEVEEYRKQLAMDDSEE